MNRAAFFDRDGTINVDVGYLHRPEDIVFVPGTPELIRKYNDEGWLVIVITNQSGIARGMFTKADVDRVHAAMNERLEREYGAHIDVFYCCPHLPEITGPCTCRKPKPGLFLRAMREHDIDPLISVSYGDSKRDEEASKAAGIRDFIYLDCGKIPWAGDRRSKGGFEP